MKVLQKTNLAQELKFIPREYTNLVDLELRREASRGAVMISDLPAITSGGYLSVESVFDLKEDSFYELTVFNKSGDVIYRDKVLCTNQTNYSILDGMYTARAQNKKYATR